MLAIKAPPFPQQTLVLPWTRDLQQYTFRHIYTTCHKTQQEEATVGLKYRTPIPRYICNEDEKNILACFFPYNTVTGILIVIFLIMQ